MNNSEVDVGYAFPLYGGATMTPVDGDYVCIRLVDYVYEGRILFITMKIDGMYQLLEHARKLKPKESHDRDTDRVA